MIFVIPGNPQGKARPKVTRNGTYTPRKTREYEELIRACYKQAGGLYFDAGEPLMVCVGVYCPVPKNATKANRERMLAGEIKPTKRPDWDNVGKVVCDALNGIAYHDDAQIVRATVIKRYAIEPHVTVCIKEVTHGQAD